MAAVATRVQPIDGLWFVKCIGLVLFVSINYLHIDCIMFVTTMWSIGSYTHMMNWYIIWEPAFSAYACIFAYCSIIAFNSVLHTLPRCIFEYCLKITQYENMFAQELSRMLRYIRSKGMFANHISFLRSTPHNSLGNIRYDMNNELRMCIYKNNFTRTSSINRNASCGWIEGLHWGKPLTTTTHS